jgi:hypothetical protein
MVQWMTWGAGYGEGRGVRAHTLWTRESASQERKAEWWLKPPAEVNARSGRLWYSRKVEDEFHAGQH